MSSGGVLVFDDLKKFIWSQDWAVAYLKLHELCAGASKNGERRWGKGEPRSTGAEEVERLS